MVYSLGKLLTATPAHPPLATAKRSGTGGNRWVTNTARPIFHYTVSAYLNGRLVSLTRKDTLINPLSAECSAGLMRGWRNFVASSPKA